MAINTFRASIISKASSSVFKGGVREKKDLAKIAGSGGLSGRQLDKQLKERGYDPQKRREIIGGISGAKGSGGLTTEQVRKNLRSFIQKDASAVESMRGGAQKANISALGKVGGGVKGTAARLGVKQVSADFAGQQLKK